MLCKGRGRGCRGTHGESASHWALQLLAVFIEPLLRRSVWANAGRRFQVVFKYWMNGRPAKRMYLLDNCYELIAAHELRAGMSLDFYATEDGRHVSPDGPCGVCSRVSLLAMPNVHPIHFTTNFCLCAQQRACTAVSCNVAAACRCRRAHSVNFAECMQVVGSRGRVLA